MNPALRELLARAELMTRHEYRAIRKSLGSQTAVAKRLEKNRSTIQRRESGEIRITGEAALAILGLQKGQDQK